MLLWQACRFLRQLWSNLGMEYEVKVPCSVLFDKFRDNRACSRNSPDRVFQPVLSAGERIICESTLSAGSETQIYGGLMQPLRRVT